MAPVDRNWAEKDLATIRGFQSGHTFEQRGLAGTVRADEPENLAGPDREAGVVERVKSSIGLGESIDPNNGVSGVVLVHYRAPTKLRFIQTMRRPVADR
jgi:hypothetical protein